MSDSRSTLPTHPSMRHPLTGVPLRAVWVRPDGRPVWPIIGAAPDNPPADGGGGSEGGTGSTGGAPAASSPASGDTSGAGAGSGDKPTGQNNNTGTNSDTSSKSGGDTDKGFPADKPWQEMTVDQQAAYWKDKAQVHETRNKDLLKITGGKFGDDLKKDLTDLESLRTKNMTESERAVEQARKEARSEAEREFGQRLVEAEFRAALAPMERAERDEVIAGLNLGIYLTEDGKVDTDKVQNYASKIAPTAKDAGNQRLDYGAGRRGTGQASGVSAGADLYAASRKKTTNS